VNRAIGAGNCSFCVSAIEIQLQRVNIPSSASNMRFCLAWSLLGTGVVAATRFVGEFGAPEFSHATLKKVFKSPDATDSVWTEALTGFEKQAWSLQVSVANDVPLEDQKPGDEVSQLTMLSLVRGKVPDIKVEMCVVAFIGQFEKPEDAEKRVAYQACGLSKKTCKEELEQLAKSHPNCDFDLPKSCKDASGREWKKFSTSMSTHISLSRPSSTRRFMQTL
jgi:hypothetical protein